MSITNENAIKILTRYDNEYYTPATREAHRMGAEALKHYTAVPETNADRIRAMSDEELAKLICKIVPMSALPKAVRDIYWSSRILLHEAWLRWLWQPAEVE